MAEVIRMPLLSDTMKEGKIVSWLKKTGDKVTSDDILAEVETDKATMEVVGYVEGELLYIGVEEGDFAQVNQIIAIIGKSGENISDLISSPPQEAAPPKTSATKTSTEPLANITTEPIISGVTVVTMPLLSDTMKEGKIVAWLKNVGDKVESDDALAEVETDKATMEVLGYAEGVLLYQGVPINGSVPVNEIIAIVGPAGQNIDSLLAYHKSKNNQPSISASPQDTTEAQAPSTLNAHELKEPVAHTDRIKVSPLAKKIAAEKGISIAQINGTGEGGRIVKKDVDNFKPLLTRNTHAVSDSMVEDFTDIPLTQIRTVIAKRLSDSKFSAPHFYLTMRLEMDNLINLRKQMNEISEVKISINDLIIKSVATSLRKHPEVNSSWMGNFIRQNHHINIGVAVAIPDGLIVPVVKFADQKSISQIANETNTLIEKAKNKKLQPHEFSGNTMTISNLGMMGIEEFTAIINPPDSCILAVGATIPTPAFNEQGEVIKKNIMKVTLSCDHRVVDGSIGAAFLQTLKSCVENPISLFI